MTASTSQVTLKTLIGIIEDDLTDVISSLQQCLEAFDDHNQSKVAEHLLVSKQETVGNMLVTCLVRIQHNSISHVRLSLATGRSSVKKEEYTFNASDDWPLLQMVSLECEAKRAEKTLKRLSIARSRALSKLGQVEGAGDRESDVATVKCCDALSPEIDSIMSFTCRALNCLSRPKLSDPDFLRTCKARTNQFHPRLADYNLVMFYVLGSDVKMALDVNPGGKSAISYTITLGATMGWLRKCYDLIEECQSTVNMFTHKLNIAREMALGRIRSQLPR